MRFYRWSPEAVDGLTGAEMLWWCEQANAMVEREQEARRRGR